MVESINHLWLELVSENTDREEYPNPVLVKNLPRVGVINWLVKEEITADTERASQVID